MDRASRVLAQGVPPSVPKSYRAIADHHGNISYSTLYHRDRGRPRGKRRPKGNNTSNPYSVTRHRPTTERPPKAPGRNWAKALEKRHPILLARRVKALDWNRHEKNIYGKIVHWFEVIKEVLQDPAVLVENVYNMDETRRDYRGARVKRTSVTAIECISGDGRYLNPMIIWLASTHRSNWTTFPTPGWQYAYSDSGYTDSKISLEWLKRIFDPETKERANNRPRVLICDGFGTHETLEILEFCFENNILLCRLPSHTSHKLQPCDVAAFAPLKAAYRDQVDRLEQGGVNTIGKEHFTSLYCLARERAFTPKNIKAGFAASGLFLFNLDRVLRSMPAPLAEPAIPCVDEVEVGTCRQDVELHYRQDVEVQTPVTPVSAEAFMSLQNLIIQRDAHALNETSKQNLGKHLQKCTKAYQKASALSVLQEDRIQYLLTINNEAKVRRSTRSLVLGKAKGKRGRKRKSGTLEAEEDTAEEDTVEEDTASARRGRKRAALDAPAPTTMMAWISTASRTQIADNEIAPEPQRAPVAQMW
ncbi:hypothetical protein LARI1_G004946 [Lachnellula arida]|uniref:DDE-1 domain-containing protein n=1 Tax=Lachnellula arida TaxID=1316785 RepID=A0A8T9BC25_9HELO|nr:hypothetical protein LARI1_G004946 [Lachnellula arida]